MKVDSHSAVMPGLVPGPHAFSARRFEDVDGRNQCGHDDGATCSGFKGEVAL
jgi:hypothetical protein